MEGAGLSGIEGTTFMAMQLVLDATLSFSIYSVIVFAFLFILFVVSTSYSEAETIC